MYVVAARDALMFSLTAGLVVNIIACRSHTHTHTHTHTHVRTRGHTQIQRFSSDTNTKLLIKVPRGVFLLLGALAACAEALRGIALTRPNVEVTRWKMLQIGRSSTRKSSTALILSACCRSCSASCSRATNANLLATSTSSCVSSQRTNSSPSRASSARGPAPATKSSTLMLPAATTSTSAALAGEVETARGEVEAPVLLPGPLPRPARFPSAHTPRGEGDAGEFVAASARRSSTTDDHQSSMRARRSTRTRVVVGRDTDLGRGGAQGAEGWCVGRRESYCYVLRRKRHSDNSQITSAETLLEPNLKPRL